MKAVLSIILYVWQLPQNILGEVLSLCYGARRGQDYRGVRLHQAFPEKSPWGVTSS